jgi:choline dehydrogenase-like flavoprotein
VAAAFWEGLYEPLIRRAAGLGRMTKGANPELSERAFAHCDVLVIGAGPAGLIAAQTAAEAGADVILIDENTSLAGASCPIRRGRRQARRCLGGGPCGQARRDGQRPDHDAHDRHRRL